MYDAQESPVREPFICAEMIIYTDKHKQLFVICVRWVK